MKNITFFCIKISKIYNIKIGGYYEKFRYKLMGISIYIIMQSKRKLKKNARLIYYIQLVTNALWTPIFFGFKEYFLAFLWILMLIVFVITMILTFYKISKKAAYIQIPYLLWLLFASYLNFGVFVLN